MKYTNDPHTIISDDSIMNRNYSKFLSYEKNKTKIQIKFEKTSVYGIISEFNYFIPKEPEIYQPFILAEGDIFSAINNKNENFIVINNEPLKIPNAKTLDVLLFKRNLTKDNIKFLEDAELADLLFFKNGTLTKPELTSIPAGVKVSTELKKKAGGGGGGGGGPKPEPVPKPPLEIENKDAEWTPDMQLATIAQQYSELVVTAASADALLTNSIAQVENVMNVAIAEAEAAKAQSVADTTASQAAIAEANSSQAQADALRAEYEYKINNPETK